MRYTRKSFYTSETWQTFRKNIIDERKDSEGFNHCSVCGKPIVNKYDLILHHKIELTDDNVNNAEISLNPKLINIVCFACHNKEHDRFQGGNQSSGWKMPKKKVYIVYGSPCAGKSTFVRNVAEENDLVVDIDNIWQMISNNKRRNKPNGLMSVVFQIRDKLYDIIKYRDGKWRTAYVITGSPMKGDRERLQQRIGADELIHIDTDKAECLRRLNIRCHEENLEQEQIEDMMRFIDNYFERYQE